MSGTGEAGRVILAGTPLGNVRDASPRLGDALATAAVIAAEDTRRVRRLCADLGVTPRGRVVSFFDGNEQHRVPELLDVLREGHDVLVVTDAGMPSISDPGYRLVAAAVASGVAVTTLPGPSAVTAALAVSGLPVHRFCFEGFLPRKAGDRRRLLDSLAAEQRTMVFFEAPHRLAADARELGRCVRSGPAGGGVPRTDQDLRAGPAGPARRTGRLGRGRGARRDHSRGDGRRAWSRRRFRPLILPARWRFGRYRASRARRPSPPSPPAWAFLDGWSMTLSWRASSSRKPAMPRSLGLIREY